MKTAQNNNKFVEKLIKNLDLDLTTNKAAHDAVCQDVLIAHKQSTKTTARQQNIYRIIMKIPITKLSTAAAAVIIITVLSGIYYWPSLKNYFNYNQQPVKQFNSYDALSGEIQDDRN